MKWLDWLHGRSVPYVPSFISNECGLASLAMTLGYHGRQVSLQDLRAAMDPTAGLTALDLIALARKYGLAGRGVSCELDGLAYLEPGSILYWGFQHYVVLERVTARGVRVVDCNTGHRQLSWRDAGKDFSGVALCFEAGAGPAFLGRPAASWSYLSRVLRDWRSWTSVLVTSLILQTLWLALPGLSALCIDRLLPGHDVLALRWVAWAVVGLAAFHFATRLVRTRLLLYARTRLDTTLSNELIGHVAGLAFRSFERRPLSGILETLASPAAVREALTSAVLSGFVDGAFALLYLGLLGVANPMLAAVVFACGLLELGVAWAGRQRLADDAGQLIYRVANLHEVEQDLVLGMESIRAMALDSWLLEAWANRYAEAANAALRRDGFLGLVDTVVEMLRFACPLAVLAVGAANVIDGRIEVGAMFSLVVLASGLLNPLSNLVLTAFQLPFLAQHVRRIQDILLEPLEQPDRATRRSAALKGAVALEKVDFSYGENVPFRLTGVSLEASTGQMVAIVGRSGSGKSTVAKLLTGLYAPAAGRVLYDGSDLAGLDLSAIRRQLGVVTQRSALARMSIRLAISGADPSCNLEAVIEAARRACIHDEISALPMGYETLLDSDGGGMSGGQRQRIALARALVRQPKVLILDEATNALDAVTEQAVFEQLAVVACTRIVIAHRLSTIASADVIWVMDGGKVVQRGTHAALSAEAGPYRELIRAQSGELRPAVIGRAAG